MSREEQDLQVAIAMAYAADGDPWGMIAHFQRANLLDGIRISFRRRWPGLPDEEVDDMIAVATERLYEKVSGGNEVANPIGYMLEVMRHEAADYVAERRNIVPLDTGRDHGECSGFSRGVTGARAAAALLLARSLLPQLGEQSVQAVMGHIFSAVEDGRSQVTTEELVEATGLTNDAVRQCRSRGFRRLERIVRKEGLAPPSAASGDQESSTITEQREHMRSINERLG